MATDRDGAATKLDALQTLVQAAQELADGLASDPLLERLLRAFTALAEHDREVVLKVLERDATWCRIVRETAEATGITVRPNPHASLYLHVVGQGQTDEPLRRDVEIIRRGIETFVTLLPLFFQEEVHEQWTTSARELVRGAPPELLGYARRLAEEVVALVDAAAAER